MRLRPIDYADWLPDRADASERARKLTLLTSAAQRRDAAVYDHSFDSSDLERRAAQTIADALGGDVPSVPQDVNCGYELGRPLVRAALAVPDDLCVIALHGDHAVLVAGVLCAPSYWRLHDKIGRTLVDVHAPVPSLNEKLAERMHRFLVRMPEMQPFERHNWFVHGSEALYAPDPEPVADVLSALSRGEAWIRTERQTLLRFAPDGVLFSIRVRLFPFTGLQDHPQAARTMWQALDAKDADEINAFGGAAKADAVKRAIENMVPDA